MLLWAQSYSTFHLWCSCPIGLCTASCGGGEAVIEISLKIEEHFVPLPWDCITSPLVLTRWIGLGPQCSSLNIHMNKCITWFFFSSFRKHEWDKHGTCVAMLDSLNSEKKYFSKALEFYGKLDLNRFGKILFQVPLFFFQVPNMQEGFQTQGFHTTV